MPIKINDPQAFVKALKAAAPVASRDKTRPTLMQVRIVPHEGHGAVVATDTYRMSFERVDIGWTKDAKPFGVLCTSMSNVLRRKKWEPTKIHIGKAEAAFTDADGKVVRLPLVEGDYPRWDNIVDPYSYGIPLCFDAGLLINAVRSAMKCESEEDNKWKSLAVCIDFPSSIVMVRRPHSRLMAQLRTKQESVLLNNEYLIHALRTIGSGPMLMQRGIEGKVPSPDAYLITGEERPEFRYALMRMST